MSEKVGLKEKKSKKERKNSSAAKQNRNFYQSLDSPINPVLHLQKTVGNQAVQRLIKSGTIWTKLKIGKTNDKYEMEADRIAEKVMSMPESTQSLVKRQSTCPACKEKGDNLLRRQPIKGARSSRQSASKRANQIFKWLEIPLQRAVKHPGKIDKWIRARGKGVVAGLVLMYNKMRNENVWQYVKEIKDASPKVSCDFFPTVSHSSLPRLLKNHGYIDCLASSGIDWGLRKENACGPHLHFKHFNPGDQWVSVHIDKIDPCCGGIPILSPIIYGIWHYFVDKLGWNKRKAGDFIKLLKKQKVPLSSGTLNYLKRIGHI